MLNNKRMKIATPTSAALFTITEPMSPISEQFKTLRTNIQFSSVDTPVSTVVVTSSGPSEGKSTIAANLAVVFAQTGLKTIIVDADLRRPTVHLTFDVSNTTGLSSLLSVRRLSLIDVTQVTDVPNLDVIPNGPKSPNPSELLSSERMRKVIQLLDAKYDVVIFDMPPIVSVTDAQIISSQVDGVILAVKEEKTDKKTIKKSVDLLRNVGANILGAVYIGKQSDASYGYYYN